MSHRNPVSIPDMAVLQCGISCASSACLIPHLNSHIPCSGEVSRGYADIVHAVQVRLQAETIQVIGTFGTDTDAEGIVIG